ncbi:MAG: quinol-cytochrome oxidoreductase complex cytochrome b subunit [Halobacteriales archaeon]|jgi:quinol-cytochrome oxidoreductase complex cytochrome b subunit
MPAAHLAQMGAEAQTAIAVARTLAFVTIIVAASVLVYYLTVYVREVLVSTYEDRWWYLAVGVAAAIVYGVSGLAELTTAYEEAAAAFRIGATLFFFLFSAVGVRALYATVKLDRGDVDSLSIPE